MRLSGLAAVLLSTFVVAQSGLSFTIPTKPFTDRVAGDYPELPVNFLVTSTPNTVSKALHVSFLSRWKIWIFQIILGYLNFATRNSLDIR